MKMTRLSRQGLQSNEMWLRLSTIDCDLRMPGRWRRGLMFACILGLVACGRAACDDGPQSPIATDRPSVTDSSVVVPIGSVQVENGFTDTANQGENTLDGPETLLRFGLLSKTELRLTVPDYFGAVTGSGASSGFGDMAIGMKQQLGPAKGFDVSLVLTLSVPTGARAISSHDYDPSLQVPWSRAVSAHWTIAGMLSMYWPTQEYHRNLTGETTFLIDRQLTNRGDVFAEYAGDFPERGGTRNLAHFGTTWKLTPRQQIDFHVGVGLSSAAVDHFIGFGYSFRLQARRH
jgi:hypothetical protein